MLLVKNIKIDVKEYDNYDLKTHVVHKLQIKEKDIECVSLIHRAIDARKKEQVFYVCDVLLKVKNEKNLLKLKNVIPYEEKKYEYPSLKKEWTGKRPIVVGSGPAGLFCTYILAKSGLKPTLLEQGECIEKRVLSVEKFWETGELNSFSNVQFGEGGAGTFSDGKLNTSCKDDCYRDKEVLRLFVEFGAPEEILYDSKPHIGTDILRTVIKNMREKLLKLGCEIHYETKFTDFVIENDQLIKIQVNDKKWIDCDHLVLAIGHSARDTFRLLYEKKLKMEVKPFAIGFRVEHCQQMINESQYGDYASYLPPARYKLVYHSESGRGIYSFCMCPGGYVVNASSEKNGFVINGMSEYHQDTHNANSAIIVSVNQSDFGDGVLNGVLYQELLEHRVYQYGQGKIPVQRYEDFVNKIKSESYGLVHPVHKGESILANLWDIMPDYLCESLLEAMPYFGKKIDGFDDKDTLISVIESRSSSPVRILRNDCMVSNIQGIYPCGEGAGYAGGIMTSAMDGIKVAEKIIYEN